ncbi:NAD(P)H-hydrate dehydratase [Candidatus Nitrotoga arctica]|uniref:ADP-dependent (S)-NAD(P)H-hydrate dehydratase n=1 Tax=Candidatus Nitrotoga arctica TaxID=453162 RepID=A0ABM8YYV6_9PROT|nr:NAD(P)H-hydrate dehydratase [Candidatus Nitrotoga arctica]CAG9932749.1 ADP-dependent (S)-NAD(P)H-hydrate dehydratase [Candidatus Nitrotoga arctica]
MPAAPRIPTITQKQVATFLSPRPRDSHKGNFGTVAVIGGASGMVGAPLLAARAALKLGTGCVHVGMLADNALNVDILQPELMLHSAQAALRLPKLDVLAIGCGMGYDDAAQKILHDALKLDTVLVLDADALNILALRPDLHTVLSSRKNANVITPHPGEAARLLGCNTEEVQAARAETAQELAKRFHSTVVLKGAHSLCVTRDGKTYVNKTGNPGMSSPGMGDVLTGIIAAFIAQGLDVDQALLLAVHLHGAAGDAMAKQKVTIGMTATEVTEWARWLLNQWII